MARKSSVPVPAPRPRSSAWRWGLVALAGCAVLAGWWWSGRDESPRSAPAPAVTTTTTTRPVLPDAVDALWRTLDAEGAWIPVDRPDPLQVPGPDFPADASVDDIRWPELATRPDDEWPAKDEAAQTLYVERASADPWDGRAALVGRERAAVDAPGFGVEGEPVMVGAIPGHIERRGDVWIAAWQVPVISESDCEGCTQEAFVAGRGLGRDEVLALASGADVLGTPPQLLLDTLPTGLAPLSSVPLAVGDGLPAAPAEELDATADGAPLTVRLIDGDPRLVGHLAFWGTAEGDGTWRTPVGVVVARDSGAAVVVPRGTTTAAAVDPATAAAVVGGLVDGSEAEAGSLTAG